MQLGYLDVLLNRQQSHNVIGMWSTYIRKYQTYFPRNLPLNISLRNCHHLGYIGSVCDTQLLTQSTVSFPKIFPKLPKL